MRGVVIPGAFVRRNLGGDWAKAAGLSLAEKLPASLDPRY
jgi:hypothetical protein